MIKRTLTGVALALAATTSLAETGPETVDEVTAAEPLMLAGVRVGNPFDPSTWWDGSEGHDQEEEMVAFNFSDPDFWMGFVRPETHSRIHLTVTNPASWSAFMKPDTYTNMMDVNVWMKWMDTDTYAPFADLQTFAYWLQPGAYGHMVDKAHYAQLAEVDNYKVLLDTAADTFGLSEFFATTTE